MISRPDVRDYCLGRQQNYATARALLPKSFENLNIERETTQEHLDGVLETLLPFLSNEVVYETCLVDTCDVAETLRVDDGGQLICIGRHFIVFLRDFVEIVTRGIRLGDSGSAIVDYAVNEDDKKSLGCALGEHLNFGVPLTFLPRQSGEFGPDVYIAAIEFVLAHEIAHRIEEDSPDDRNLDLDGFQDFCRLRGREYRCDRRAVALILERRKGLDMPEMAFLGAICALMAIAWIEQFTPGYVPDSLVHPGSDSRVLRIHLEEELFWKASGLDAQPTRLTGAALRRVFRIMAALEDEPNFIVSPLNHLIHHCISGGTPNHERFEASVGEFFARGRVEHVARSLGAMWGSSERIAESEPAGVFKEPQGQLACALFSRMHDKMQSSGAAVREVAELILRARGHRVNLPEP